MTTLEFLKIWWQRRKNVAHRQWQERYAQDWWRRNEARVEELLPCFLHPVALQDIDAHVKHAVDCAVFAVMEINARERTGRIYDTPPQMERL